MDDDEEFRRDYTMMRSWWRAMAGTYVSWEEVADSMVADGFPHAREWLGDPELRGTMDEVCRTAIRLDRENAVAPPRPAPRSDEEAVWRVLEDEHAATWNREYERWAALFVHAPYLRWYAWVRGGGIALRHGWDELDLHMRQDIEKDPDRNPYFAFQFRAEDRNLRIGGSVAWVTFDCVFPTDRLPGFRGPGRGHQMFVLERQGGAWKIAFVNIIDEQLGQTDTPMWQVDIDGRVLMQNLAAERFVRAESEFEIRGGRVHIHDRDTNRRLLELIGWLMSRDRGAMSWKRSMPLVYDPGNDEPARVWWVRCEGGKVFVSVNDPQLTEECVVRAARAHGLSPSQERLAVKLVQGLPLAEAAKASGVRTSTARTQLQRIFDKLGVRTQPLLVRSLLSVTEPD